MKVINNQVVNCFMVSLLNSCIPHAFIVLHFHPAHPFIRLNSGAGISFKKRDGVIENLPL